MYNPRQNKTQMPRPEEALPGRTEAIRLMRPHFVLNRPLQEPVPDNLQKAQFGMGCFWGAEKKFWGMDGVYLTAVGYAGGYTPNPTYDEVCSGCTGHNEVVWVVYDPGKLAYESLLKQFWESHDPTQMMRQGNDVGTQYRSGIYTYTEAQKQAALLAKARYQQVLNKRGFGVIATEIMDAAPFYFAEEYHQQYLAKNPQGYCGLGGTGVPY